MNRQFGRRTQGVALIVVGVVAIVIAVVVLVTDGDSYSAQKEPFIALLGVAAIVGGIGRLLGKIGN